MMLTKALSSPLQMTSFCNLSTGNSCGIIDAIFPVEMPVLVFHTSSICFILERQHALVRIMHEECPEAGRVMYRGRRELLRAVEK